MVNKCWFVLFCVMAAGPWWIVPLLASTDLGRFDGVLFWAVCVAVLCLFAMMTLRAKKMRPKLVMVFLDVEPKPVVELVFVLLLWIGYKIYKTPDGRFLISKGYPDGRQIVVQLAKHVYLAVGG